MKKNRCRKTVNVKWKLVHSLDVAHVKLNDYERIINLESTTEIISLHHKFVSRST